jgi:hypothetical protein
MDLPDAAFTRRAALDVSWPAVVEAGLTALEAERGGAGEALPASAVIQALVAAEVARHLPAEGAAVPGPLPPRGWRGDALVAAAREEGFGPGSPMDAKIAKAVELDREGVPGSRIGELFGVSRQRVHVWLQREERKAAEGSGERLERARSRSAGSGAVRHVTPRPAGGTAVFQQPGGEPVAGAEVPVAADHGRKRGRAS